jgi:penicillin-binding protein 1C
MMELDQPVILSEARAGAGEAKDLDALAGRSVPGAPASFVETLGVPPPKKPGWRCLFLRTIATALAASVLAIVAWWLLTPSPRELLARSPAPSLTISDRYGAALRVVPGRDGTRWRPVALADVSPRLVDAVLAAEDRRFFLHPGVDPLALARALAQDLHERRVVSGGSTVTMQLARILDPRPRSLAAKLVQIALALRLEAALTKREILAEYLSRAPMGNRLIGFAAASEAYLGKPCRQLSPAEAALLASVPHAPSRANPWSDGATLRLRRDAVLARMRRLGSLDEVALAAALAEPVVLASDPFRYPAPHFLARVEEEAGALPPGAARIASTLDPALQRLVEAIVRRSLDDLAAHGVHHMAAVVLDIGRHEWLAIEGSGGFWDRPGGRLDGSRAPRQPGSALKPFTYAEAFDHGFSPATVLPDIPFAFAWSNGTWTPRNYDERFHGPLRARSALACSVNVPAAFLLDQIGPTALLATLQRAGIDTLAHRAEYYGLGLTLGGGEVRLDELTLAYAALLSGGEWHGAASVRAVLDADGRVLRRPALPPPRRVCSPEAAAQVVDILADPEARASAFGAWSVLRLPFAAAVKTGTSEAFRDNWCVGGTREVVVGVWCGNFDRTAMGNVSGVTGAGAAWREIMLAWAGCAHPGENLALRQTLLEPPADLVRAKVCALSGLRPGPDCPATVVELLRPEQVPPDGCDWHVRGADGRTHTLWPPLYRAWAAGAGLQGDAVAAVASSPGAVRSAAVRVVDPTRGAALAVAAPANGDAFVITPEVPRRFQTLELRCAVQGSPAEVVWLVDGEEYARAAAPYAASWQIAAGEHRIEVAAGAQRSRAVTVTVYGR